MSSFEFDMYDREVERYGGSGGIELAEDIFCADSAAVAALLGLRRRTPLARQELAVLSADNLVASLGLSIPERQDFYQFLLRRQYKAKCKCYRNTRKVIHEKRRQIEKVLFDPTWLRSQPDGSSIDSILGTRASALGSLGRALTEAEREGKLDVDRKSFLGSCFHMHINRLCGSLQALEMEVVMSLEAVTRSIVHRHR